MNCSIDWKAYFLDEAAADERRQAEQHLAVCAACREELDRLRITQAALLSVRDEELPRRIAFVSDKVFEPRWYQRLWNSGPRLAFASAAMLSCAILVHAFYRPVPAVPIAAVTAPATDIEARVEAEVSRRIEGAVRQATAETESRWEKKTAEMVAAAEQRLQLEHRADLLAVQEGFEVLRKRMNVLYMASAEMGAAR